VSRRTWGSPSAELERVGSGFGTRAIYTTVRMLENTSRTATLCHILTSATGRPRREMRSLSRTGRDGSEISGGLFSDSKTSWQYSSQNCHFETGVLFTMSGELAEDVNREYEYEEDSS
jgi:hypothetical protein